jgi:adenosylhomocysteine nucleosidase
VDTQRVTFACATRTEARAARRAGARTEVVGIGARRGFPDGALVSFGLAGALHDGLSCGDVLDATRIVDAAGNVLWEGGPVGLAPARSGTLVFTGTLVDDPQERQKLHEQTGADAIDMESGALARSGRLAGCLRAISDTPSRTLGPLAHAVDGEGRLRWSGLARALARPRESGRALADVRRALRSLEETGT